MIDIPDTEKRIFKYGILPNKLKYVITQDIDSDNANVSLVVKVGSMHDPPQYMGLAHFLEHMLFLGSVKNKDKGESYFEEEISKAGGSSNAFTDSFETCYFFDILNGENACNLDKILSLYSRFFIDPLFNEDSVTREINAINSEHLKNVNNEYWFVKQIIHNLSHKDSGINRFSTGTLETLGGNIKKLRQAMIDFYDTFYCANNMCIAIQSPSDISIVEEILKKYFSSIKMKKLPNDIIVKDIKFDVNKEYQIIPISEARYILYVWDIETKFAYLFNKANEIVDCTMSFNSDNNLGNVLKKLGLAQSIEIMYLNEGIFILKVNLRKNEFTEINLIIKQYLDSFLQKLDWNKLVDYMIKKNQLNYKNDTKNTNSSLVEFLSMNLHYYDEKNLFNGNCIVIKPDYNSVKLLVKKLTLGNANIFYCTKDTISTDIKFIEDKYYLKKYGELKTSFLKFTQTKEYDFSIELDESILDIKPTIIRNLNEYEIPSLIDCNNRRWYGASDRFNEMVVYGSIYFTNNNYVNSVENYMLSQIAINVINQYLSVQLCQEFEIGYIALYSLDETKGNISLLINGLNYNYKKFYEKVIKILNKIKINELIVTLIINTIKENLQDYKTMTAWEYTSYILVLQIFKYSYKVEDKLAYIEKLLYDNYIDKINIRIQEIISSDASITSVFYGNIRKEDIPFIKSNYNNNKIPPSLVPVNTIIKNPNSNDTNKSVMMLFPMGIFYPPTNANMLLLVLLMKQPAYQQLRTKEQLGYMVSCDTLCDNFNYYITIKVQSEKDIEYIKDKMNIFIEYFKDYLKKLSESTFDNMKQTLHSMLLVTPNNIQQFKSKYTNEIERRTFIFHRNELIAECVTKIKLSDIILLYDNIIPKMITICVN